MGRRMTFKVNSVFSSERPLNGGSPQGTLLGNYMFVITTDRLELKNDANHITTASASLTSTPWNPSEIGSPVRRRPSVLSLGGDQFATSSPVTATAPTIDDFSSGSEDDEADSFTYFRPLRAPLNRIDDTVDPALISLPIRFVRISSHCPVGGIGLLPL